MKTRCVKMILATCALAVINGAAQGVEKYWNPTVGNNWNFADNWYPSGVPISTSVVIFDGNTNSANCTIDANADVLGILIKNAYPGTITQEAGNTVTIGASGYEQHSGTFSGGDADIVINGTYTLSGGTFRSTSGTMRVGVSSTLTFFTLSGEGVFEHNSGTVWFDSALFSTSPQTYTINVASPIAFCDFIIRPRGNTGSGNSHFNVVGEKIVVDNNFTFSNINNISTGSAMISDGTIEVRGNMVLENQARGGTATVKVNGAGNQEYQASGNSSFPFLVIDKSSGTVLPAEGTTGVAMRNFTLSAGTFTAPTGTMTVDGGNVNATVFAYTAGTFNHNGGTLRFNQSDFALGRTHTISLAHTLVANNLEYDKTHTGSGGVTYVLSGASATIVAEGSFTMHRTGAGGGTVANSGDIEVRGDIAINDGAAGGTTRLGLTGGNDQSASRTGGTPPQGKWTIDKSGGTVGLGSNLSLNGSNQDLDWLGGGLDLGTNMLSVTRHVTIGEDATTLDLTVADATIAGKLDAGGTVSGIGNVGLEVSVTAEPEETEGLTYTILSNNTAFGVGVEFASETWLDGWKGDVLYTANDGKNVTLANLRYGAPGTLFMVH